VQQLKSFSGEALFRYMLVVACIVFTFTFICYILMYFTKSPTKRLSRYAVMGHISLSMLFVYQFIAVGVSMTALTHSQFTIFALFSSSLFHCFAFNVGLVVYFLIDYLLVRERITGFDYFEVICLCLSFLFTSLLWLLSYVLGGYLTTKHVIQAYLKSQSDQNSEHAKFLKSGKNDGHQKMSIFFLHFESVLFYVVLSFTTASIILLCTNTLAVWTYERSNHWNLLFTIGMLIFRITDALLGVMVGFCLNHLLRNFAAEDRVRETAQSYFSLAMVGMALSLIESLVFLGAYFVFCWDVTKIIIIDLTEHSFTLLLKLAAFGGLGLFLALYNNDTQKKTRMSLVF